MCLIFKIDIVLELIITVVCVLSPFSHVRLCAIPWIVAFQASLSMEFSRQEYWSGLPFPPPEDLPHPRIEHRSPTSPGLTSGFFPTVPPGKPYLSSRA